MKILQRNAGKPVVYVAVLCIALFIRANREAIHPLPRKTAIGAIAFAVQSTDAAAGALPPLSDFWAAEYFSVPLLF